MKTKRKDAREQRRQDHSILFIAPLHLGVIALQFSSHIAIGTIAMIACVAVGCDDRRMAPAGDGLSEPLRPVASAPDNGADETDIDSSEQPQVRWADGDLELMRRDESAAVAKLARVSFSSGSAKLYGSPDGQGFDGYELYRRETAGSGLLDHKGDLPGGMLTCRVESLGPLDNDTCGFAYLNHALVKYFVTDDSSIERASGRLAASYALHVREIASGYQLEIYAVLFGKFEGDEFVALAEAHDTYTTTGYAPADAASRPLPAEGVESSLVLPADLTAGAVYKLVVGQRAVALYSAAVGQLPAVRGLLDLSSSEESVPGGLTIHSVEIEIP